MLDGFDRLFANGISLSNELNGDFQFDWIQCHFGHEAQFKFMPDLVWFDSSFGNKNLASVDSFDYDFIWKSVVLLNSVRFSIRIVRSLRDQRGILEHYYDIVWHHNYNISRTHTGTQTDSMSSFQLLWHLPIELRDEAEIIQLMKNDNSFQSICFRIEQIVCVAQLSLKSKSTTPTH